MAVWNDNELRRINDADELQIAPVRCNGDLRRPSTIWAVRADDDVYVRAAYLPGSVWHRVARASHQARVWAGGLQRDVTVEDAEGSVLDAVDAAYREKYGSRYASIVEKINDNEHRATTLRLRPREQA